MKYDRKRFALSREALAALRAGGCELVDLADGQAAQAVVWGVEPRPAPACILVAVEPEPEADPDQMEMAV